MYSYYRIDNWDVDKARDTLKRYVRDHHAKFLLVKEEASQGGKPHLQGWCYHTAKQSAYTTYFNRAYPGKSFEKDFGTVRDIDKHASYMLRNTTKDIVPYEDVITNYTEEEYDEWCAKPIFEEKRPHKLKGQLKSKDWWMSTCEQLESQCVKDGVIYYSMLPAVFYSLPQPKMLSGERGLQNLNGMIHHLELKYESEDNKRSRTRNIEYAHQKGNGLFDMSKAECLEYKKSIIKPLRVIKCRGSQISGTQTEVSDDEQK